MENAGEPLREFIKGLRWEEEFLFEKGRECSPTTAFMVLFATAFLIPLLIAATYFPFSYFDGHPLIRLLLMPIDLSLIFLGIVPVAYLNIRSARLVLIAMLPGAILGALIPLYGVIYAFNDYAHPTVDELMRYGDDPFHCFMVSIGILSSACLIAFIPAGRTRLPFSAKTYRWLQPYRSKKRFVLGEIIPVDKLTYDDVLCFEPTKQKLDTYRIALCLDHVADGDSVLWVRFWPKNKFLQKWTTYPGSHGIPLTRQQVETLARNFGPFKRCSPLSAMFL